MQNEKRTEIIAVRVTKETKIALEKYAEEKDWSTSKVAEKILRQWAEKQENNKEINIIGKIQNIEIN